MTSLHTVPIRLEVTVDFKSFEDVGVYVSNRCANPNHRYLIGITGDLPVLGEWNPERGVICTRTRSDVGDGYHPVSHCCVISHSLLFTGPWKHGIVPSSWSPIVTSSIDSMSPKYVRVTKLKATVTRTCFVCSRGSPGVARGRFRCKVVVDCSLIIIAPLCTSDHRLLGYG